LRKIDERTQALGYTQRTEYSHIYRGRRIFSAAYNTTELLDLLLTVGVSLYVAWTHGILKLQARLLSNEQK